MKKPVYATQCSLEQGDERLSSFLNTLNGELHEFELKRCFTTDKQRYSAQRLAARANKRCRYSDSADLETAALDAFRNTNASVSSVMVKLDPDIVCDARLFIRLALERFTADYSSGIQECLNLTLLSQLWRFGPGSSFQIEGSHFAEKILSKHMTVTERALPLAELICKMNPYLRDSYISKEFEFKLVRGSSISTVPKNKETRRTIATEPLFNMALQLAAGAYIEGALRRVGLDISTQESRNKRLAEVGSRFDNLATIDLKSASDMISMPLIKALWPTEWFELLTIIRSPETRINGEWIPLNMISTMGNGFTFPMMTMTILALLYASQSYRGQKPMYIDYTKCAVYGDDVILPCEDFTLFSRILSDAGFIVNADKSYASGAFRESCGGDFYFGEDVTPFYVKNLNSDPAVYVAINQLIDWMARQSIWLPNTLRCLASFLHSPSPFLVPCWEAPYAGVRTSLGPRRYKRFDIVPFRKWHDTENVNANLSMLMVLGGYVTSSRNSTICFMPRARRPRYKVESCVYPRGYSSGFDPILRDQRTQVNLDFFVHEVLGVRATY